MRALCPFCKSQYDIDDEHLNTNIECATCGNKFICSFYVKPVMGPMFLDVEFADKSNRDISILTWWCNGEWRSWVNGQSSPEQFITCWAASTELITWSGRRNDENRIIKLFEVEPHVNFNNLALTFPAEVDKSYFSNILLDINEQVPREYELIDEKIAVKLWGQVAYGKSPKSLESLQAYAAWNVVALCQLKEYSDKSIINKMLTNIPYQFHSRQLEKILPKKTSSGTKKRVGKIQDFWEERKNNPLTTIKDAEICITGELKKSDIDQAEETIEDLGGFIKSSAVRTLDFLIVGDTGEYGKTTKMKKAEEYIEKGAHTRIIDEDAFWLLVDTTKRQRESTGVPSTESI